MNGTAKTLILVGLALGVGIGAWYFFGGNAGNAESSGGDGSDGGASGDLGGGADQSADASSAEGVIQSAASWAAGVAMNAGIGVTKGIRNNNPGNLRYVASIAWDGQTGDDGTGYAVFDTAEHGIRALGHQLMDYANRGIDTVTGIISTYAPSNENDTDAYVADVAGRLGIGPTDAFDVAGSLPQLAAAVIQHENGVQPYAASDIATWVNEA